MASFKMANRDVFLPFTSAHVTGCENFGGHSIPLKAAQALGLAGLALLGICTFRLAACTSGGTSQGWLHRLHFQHGSSGFEAGLGCSLQLSLDVLAPFLSFLLISSSPACSDSSRVHTHVHRTDPCHCPRVPPRDCLPLLPPPLLPPFL